MKKRLVYISLLALAGIVIMSSARKDAPSAVIRVNLLGYKPSSTKVAVWASRDVQTITHFRLVDVLTGKTVFEGKAGKPFGAYGPFAQTYRLDFSAFTGNGSYLLQAGDAASPEFTIGDDVYRGAADFCLRYMRQQRSGFNPFLKDSCHTHDGYTMYGPMPDSTHIDVSGGWHDASDYLQYTATSANATYHLLAAHRDFPSVFMDKHQANGLPGWNGRADVLDEAKWGLDWLLKMNPKENWLFNQLGDDRDHAGMRIPKEDSFYGKGFERPVYFCTGKPQGLFRYKNRSTGLASTAGKFSSAFSLGYMMLRKDDPAYAEKLLRHGAATLLAGMRDTGVCQTAPGRAPYFYEEDNWRDDMQLAAALYVQAGKQKGTYLSGKLTADDPAVPNRYEHHAMQFARQEPLTPWLGADTARHYQWYPFINAGHYELAKVAKPQQQRELVGFYKTGIEKVWQKAKQNAFYRGVPFIWCSNNLTTSFAIQCYWYRQLSGDPSYTELEQANVDWLFGCNPWGTSFVYGLPAWGDTPQDPHSAFTHLKKYPIDGGLVDGPVYGSIYKKLIGITLYEPDEYAAFQSDLVVYHDDYGDYSTNEPTMDGTASLIYLLAAKEAEKPLLKKKALTAPAQSKSPKPAAITRGDTARKQLSLVFTGDEFAEGGSTILHTLRQHNVKASFFFTGRFYRNPAFARLIKDLKKDGHYLGAHSNEHLLYCDWANRDSLLVTRQQFGKDLLDNYAIMKQFGIRRQDAPYFLPPYEWYNDSIVSWTGQLQLQLINYTPGTLSPADYTTPSMKNYRSSDAILRSIYTQEQQRGLNGYLLLMHIGAGPHRKDKLHDRLTELLQYLKAKGYSAVTVSELLKKKTGK